MTATAHSSSQPLASLASAPGVTQPSSGGPAHRFLSDALVARGLVTQAAMDAALDASRAGRRYSEVLIADGALSEEDLARTLADHHRIAHVDLDAFPIQGEALELVAPETAGRLGALPVAVLGTGQVVVAVHDPEALTNIVELRTLIGRELCPVVASRTQVERLIRAPRAAAAGRPTEAPPEPAVAQQPEAAAEHPAEPTAAPESPADAMPLPAATAAPSRPELVPPSPIATPPAGERIGATPAAPPAIAGRTWERPSGDMPPEVGAVRAADLRDLPERTVAAGEDSSVATVGALRERLAAAERRALEADERAQAAERQARYADERAQTAERHAEGMVAAAQAANEALAQLAEARAVSEQALRRDADELQELSRALDAERAERRRLEAELERHGDVPAEVVAHPTALRAVAPPPLPPASVVAPPPQPRASVDGPPPPSVATAARSPERARKSRGIRRMMAALRRS